MAKKQYTDDEVAVALAFLKASGYPTVKGAMDKAARHTGIARNTLRRWARGESHPVGANVVARKTLDLKAVIDNELVEIFDEMDVARDGASYKDLAVAAGILIEKKQLIAGEPTQRIATTVEEELEDVPPDDRPFILAEAERLLRESHARGGTAG